MFRDTFSSSQILRRMVGYWIAKDVKLGGYGPFEGTFPARPVNHALNPARNVEESFPRIRFQILQIFLLLGRVQILHMKSIWRQAALTKIRQCYEQVCLSVWSKWLLKGDTWCMVVALLPWLVAPNTNVNKRNCGDGTHAQRCETEHSDGFMSSGCMVLRSPRQVRPIWSWGFLWEDMKLVACSYSVILYAEINSYNGLSVFAKCL